MLNDAELDALVAKTSFWVETITGDNDWPQNQVKWLRECLDAITELRQRLAAPASPEVEAMAKRGDAYAAIGDDPNYPDESAAMLRALDRERTEQKAEIARLRSEWAGITWAQYLGIRPKRDKQG